MIIKLLFNYLFVLTGDTHPVLEIEVPVHDCDIRFPPPSHSPLPPLDSSAYDFSCLDDNTQQTLLNLCEENIFMKPRPDDQEILWDKRHYMVSFAHFDPSGMKRLKLKLIIEAILETGFFFENR